MAIVQYTLTHKPYIEQHNNLEECMWYISEIGKLCTGVCWGDVWERVRLEYLAVDRRIIVRWAGVDLG